MRSEIDLGEAGAKYAGRVTEGYKSCMNTWGEVRGITHTAALVLTLRWLWDRHKEAFPDEACPYDLQGMLD